MPAIMDLPIPTPSGSSGTDATIAALRGRLRSQWGLLYFGTAPITAFVYAALLLRVCGSSVLFRR